MATIQDLEFYFKITPIKIREQRKETEYDQLQHWYPPFKNYHFRRDTTNSTGWHRWTQQGITPFNAPTDPPGTKSSSIFFDCGRNYFLLVEEDCLTTDFNEMIEFDEPWKRLQFVYKPPRPDRPEMSLVKVFPADGEFMLHARGAPTWMPELIPYTYDGTERSRRANVAGELSVLLGLVAFTCEPKRHALLSTMVNNFRPPRWIPNNIAPLAPCKRSDVSRERGYVVKVAPCSGVDLEAYEDGHYGPLLAGDDGLVL
ncbi:uncharacterized protein TRUGW13939_08320 [Talaromyces rugulosus]|uniref:Uncharacterized protein n=1 Tax=Talaromyces rugulosus TaxID=121627 RepID=A0A7H8R8T6_TALRU|nr:uncharacterized protein TRUGW13939_08320 [Talaromyces rugulosus]QKX61173.1 hypothetical protein TRUGW13939_08320 [Talaromyces rugulosus]